MDLTLTTHAHLDTQIMAADLGPRHIGLYVIVCAEFAIIGQGVLIDVERRPLQHDFVLHFADVTPVVAYPSDDVVISPTR
jgi:hypothetical protein